MDIIKTDILIIGSGAAGLAAAVYAAESYQDILVIDKGAIGKSGSTVGAVQIASLGEWSHEEDTEKNYFKDIQESGRGLSDPLLLKTLTSDISLRLNELTHWGLKLDQDANKNVAIFATSGHSFPRSISARKGKTGLGILQTLIRKANSFENIKAWSDLITLELVKSQDRVTGAVVFDLKTNKLSLIQSKAVILATGGAGQLYPITSNPVQTTGDGFALALRAGAPLIDMEQVQFYPVSIITPSSLAGFCISFYHISKLYNRNGERFMKQYEPERLENTTRDKLSIAIATEVAEGRGTPNGGVFLDATEVINQVKEEFPHEYELCMERGIDLRTTYAEIGPAAHFMMGGVVINENTATTVDGLFVAGETAGGLHGGNRLGNNALSECVVFGARAGIAATATAVKNQRFIDATMAIHNLNVTEILRKKLEAPLNGKVRPIQIKREIQLHLGKYAGVLRSNEKLHKAKKHLEEIEEKLQEVELTNTNVYSREILDYVEAIHMVQTANAIVHAAAMRTESRGAHYNTDYPFQREEIYHTIAQKKHGKINIYKTPVKGE